LAPRDETVDFEVVRDVLRYFTRNPQAADTLEGVARWRLMDEVIHRHLEQVARAVDWLVSQGLLVQVSTPSAVIFRLNDQRSTQAERFLKQQLSGSRHKSGRTRKKRRSKS
jgi:hypothetical protein